MRNSNNNTECNDTNVNWSATHHDYDINHINKMETWIGDHKSQSNEDWHRQIKTVDADNLQGHQL